MPGEAVAHRAEGSGTGDSGRELGRGGERLEVDAEARQALAKALALDPNRVWAKQQLEKTPSK